MTARGLSTLYAFVMGSTNYFILVFYFNFSCSCWEPLGAGIIENIRTTMPYCRHRYILLLMVHKHFICIFIIISNFYICLFPSLDHILRAADTQIFKHAELGWEIQFRTLSSAVRKILKHHQVFLRKTIVWSQRDGMHQNQWRWDAHCQHHRNRSRHFQNC